MGLKIQIEDEQGTIDETLLDPRGLLYAVLPERPNKTFCFLPYIDPYGDTVFNRPQMEPFLKEWDGLIADCRDLEIRRLLVEVKRLASKCQNGVHLYLRFVGE